ncbi:hypothetical protein QET40_04995 [Akkermansia sp. N21169]|uniref:hypothetical protein n=1 Tax=Akkermansia sp. N21169 TaxID=3040765 RepID=UPI00244EEB34|nr:hypothetical protein [Akkermansia sp. N21169]MDH3068466.1 hypothetical protein [Akkermansia sp. N21169]
MGTVACLMGRPIMMGQCAFIDQRDIKKNFSGSESGVVPGQIQAFSSRKNEEKNPGIQEKDNITYWNLVIIYN